MSELLAFQNFPYKRIIFVNQSDTYEPLENGNVFVVLQTGRAFVFINNQIQEFPFNFIEGTKLFSEQYLANNVELFRGVQGNMGVSGPQGLQGIQGVQGLQGIEGEPGVPGTNGTNGIDGATIVAVDDLNDIQNPNTRDIYFQQSDQLFYMYNGSSFVVFADTRPIPYVVNVTSSQVNSLTVTAGKDTNGDGIADTDVTSQTISGFDSQDQIAPESYLIKAYYAGVLNNQIQFTETQDEIGLFVNNQFLCTETGTYDIVMQFNCTQKSQTIGVYMYPDGLQPGVLIDVLYCNQGANTCYGTYTILADDLIDFRVLPTLEAITNTYLDSSNITISKRYEENFTFSNRQFDDTDFGITNPLPDLPLPAEVTDTINTLINTVNDQSSAITALQNQVSDLTTDVGNLENTVTTLQATINTLNTTIDTLTNQVVTLTGNQEQLEQTVTALQTQVDTLTDLVNGLLNPLGGGGLL